MERDDAMLNSKEVAQILDLSPDTVNEFARKSILPGIKSLIALAVALTSH